jgi:hypothetical protein
LAVHDCHPVLRRLAGRAPVPPGRRGPLLRHQSALLFGGSGTVAQVATGNGRKAIHIDLNPTYIELARRRIGPMLCEGPL